MILPLFISYAEIHFHLKYLYPAYYKKQPEILADCPRKIHNNILPILIIIKDSKRFPVTLENVSIIISSKDEEIQEKIQFGIKLEQSYFSDLINIDLSSLSSCQILNVQVTFHIIQNNEKLNIINDNYPLKKEPFQVYYGQPDSPYPKGWYAGESHYHSNYTSDQVEFGADLKSTVELAKAMGLKWMFVTDHSYDLDDKVDDFLTNDPQLPKWKSMWEESQELSTEEFRIIPGEEISIGNTRDKNVHLLAVNNPEFVCGSGDSAEIWFRNKPEHSLYEVNDWRKETNLFIAAHPSEKPPISQQLTLRRGMWEDKDFQTAGIKYLQLINSGDPNYIKKAIKYWKKLLLCGRKYLLLAGNDAHGNFNSMRQIKLPFLTIFRSEYQIFGQFQTIFKYSSNNPIKGIKKGEIIVTNGIFLHIEIDGREQKYPINSICKESKVSINCEPIIPKEFGHHSFTDIILADLDKKNEKIIPYKNKKIVLSLPKRGYIRAESYSTKGGILLTNPIWIERD